ncbi:MAG: oxidoreductase [Gemmatimonadetes bacterium]|nr:oxidoreductase [Gemmatimonadota bacterium]MEC9014935.1 Gfo/Idh/MocA family oxidoreductase [Gemmatimonadota bacterium]
MIDRTAPQSRRKFLNSLAAGALAGGATPKFLSTRERNHIHTLARQKYQSANDQIQLAVIGAGGMGMADVETALSIPGVRLVAVADCFDGRLAAARENYGQDLFATRDYREVLARDDVDAVICATPDHWHKRISVEALTAGKSVYCEKPMVHSIAQGADVVRAQNESGKTFQVGSQGMSSLGNEKAKELLAAGEIGELNYAEGFWARNDPIGAWQYAIPENATEETIDWEMFLGDAPRKPYDPLRIFRWRNYRDYGTGVSGDLFVHLFSSLHFITSSVGPRKIMAQGGLRYWKDGREVPDILLGMFDYPETEAHPPFNLSLRVNFVDGTSGTTFLRLVGSEGAMDVTWTEVVLRRNKAVSPTDVFNQRKADEMDQGVEARKQMLPPAESIFMVEDGYMGAHFDHFMNFFRGVRDGRPVNEDAEFGLRAAAPALACNDSYFGDQIVAWDPEMMEVI